MANSILSFKARLCLMGQGGELVPYDTTHIRAASEADAIRLSKQWAQDAAMSEILTCKFSRRIRASQVHSRESFEISGGLRRADRPRHYREACFSGWTLQSTRLSLRKVASRWGRYGGSE